jgi:hypothetical protein
MAKRVTQEDILTFNSLYYKTRNYAQVARETGFSSSTVRKYIDKNWKPVEVKNIVRFELSSLPDYKNAVRVFQGADNYGFLCHLTSEEEEEIKELWRELAV